MANIVFFMYGFGNKCGKNITLCKWLEMPRRQVFKGVQPC